MSGVTSVSRVGDQKQPWSNSGPRRRDPPDTTVAPSPEQVETPAETQAINAFGGRLTIVATPTISFSWTMILPSGHLS